MSRGVRQTRRFARQYRRLHDLVAMDVDAAVATIAASPKLGERKKGDLADLLVFRFRSQGQFYLLGYTLDDQPRLIYLEAEAPMKDTIAISNVVALETHDHV